MTPINVYFLSAVVFSSVMRNHALESHLICKSVQDVFAPSSSGGSLSSSGVASGPPGKRGAPGSKGEAGRPGEKGDAGSPAVVNYERIEETIERKITEKMTELSQRQQNHSDNFNGVVSCKQNGGYASGHNCFTIIKASVNYQKALQLCSDIGAKPADIHSREEQNAIEQFMRSKATAYGLWIWLGMTYQHSTKSVFLYNGTLGNSNVKWFAGYPNSQSSRTRMLIQVRRDVTSIHQGVWNHQPSYTSVGVLCMKPFRNACIWANRSSLADGDAES